MAINEQYASNGDAKHYGENRLQSIIKFERTYGTLAVMVFCEITADKYRERLGKKDAVDQELIKIKWYEEAAKFFFNKLGSADEIIIDNRRKEPLPWSTIKPLPSEPITTRSPEKLKDFTRRPFEKRPSYHNKDAGEQLREDQDC